MNARDAVLVVRAARGADDIVIPSMGSAREWMATGEIGPRDFVYVPSAMGHATSLGLGLALAQPARRVIVLSGDGSLLMNLGSLVTIAAEAPANLTVVVFDNGVYEVTGAQPTPGSAAARAHADRADFGGLARAAGIVGVFEWDTLEEWERSVADAFTRTGPVVVVLRVAPTPGAVGPRSPGPTAVRGPRFMDAIR